MSETNGHAPMPGGYESVMSHGQEWKLVWDGPAIHKKFCAWAKAKARQRAETGEHLKEINRRIWAGAYDWNAPTDPSMMGEDLAITFNQAEGRTKLAQLLLEAYHGLLEDQAIADISAGNPEEFAYAIARCLYPNLRAPAMNPGQPTTQTTQPSPANSESPPPPAPILAAPLPTA